MSQSNQPSPPRPAAGAPPAAAPEAPEPPVAPGTVLAGKYRVERVIGQGGMGVVVEARHIALDDRVALKFLTAAFAQHPEAMARFHREGKAAVKIKSEHVARVSDIGTLENGAPYMVMEFLEGQDLSHELQARGVLSVPDAVDYVIQACEAIGEAHANGIIHRDIKPANLFLTRRHDGSALVKVLDFGISKMQEGVENLTKTMAAMGSALYMSPEQMQQTRGVDHRTDIYALGIALYELLAGKQPFYADTLPQLCAEVLTGTPTPLRQIRTDAPPELCAVLEKAYARDRTQRYNTVADFVIALAPFAPPRSQPNIDRVARAAGHTPPVAGAPAQPVTHGGPVLAGGGTIAMEVISPLAGLPDPSAAPARPPYNSYPGQPAGAQPTPPGGYPVAAPGHPGAPPGYPGAQAGPGAAGAPGGGHPGAQTGYPGARAGSPGAVHPGAQTGHPGAARPGSVHPGAGAPGAGMQGAGMQGVPAGQPGAGAGVSGAPGVPPGTAPNMVIAAPAPASSGSKAPLFIGVAVAVLGLAAGGFFLLRGGDSAEGPASTSPAKVSAAPTAPAAEPPATATAAEPAATTADPAATAADPAATTADPAATTAPTAEASASAPTTQPATKPVQKPPTTHPTAATKPTATKPRSVFNER